MFLIFFFFFFNRTLAYSVNKTSFYAADSPTTQVLMITNTFNYTLVIYNATLPAETKDVFSVSSYFDITTCYERAFHSAF